MSKILVTGGEGLVGSHLVHTLADMGHNVTSVDNHFNSNDNPRHPAVDYWIQDCKFIRQSNMAQKEFDYIFHLGEYARVEQSFEDIDIVMDYNLVTFPEMLKFAKEKNAKFIYSGSSTKFAVGEVGSAQSPYAFTKAQNTELLKNYSEWYGLDYTIVYFYNVYGKGEKGSGKYATVVQKFIDKAMESNDPLPVTSPGTQLRNFTHVDDIVSGLMLAGFRGNGDGYGIGSDYKYSILDLVDMLGCEPEMKPEKPGNRMDGELKTDKLKALGWSAEKDLRDYIRSQA